MIYTLNGNDITSKQFTFNEVTYPSNWCQLALPDELLNLGILSLEQIFPVLPAGHIYDGTYEDDLNLLTRTYNTKNIL